MNFRMEDIEQKLRTDVWLEDRDTHKQFSDKMRFVFLQLPLFDKEENECENNFERWIYVLKNMDTLQRLPFKARNAVFQRLEEIVDIASLSKEDRMKYDESIKVYRDNLVTELYAVQKGIKQGIEQGIQLGIQQNQENIVRRMKAKGYAVDEIADMTGLSPETINAL